MTTPIQNIIDGCENRYLNEEEEEEILRYVQDIPDLLRVARKMSQKEGEICRRAVLRVRDRYPEITRAQNETWSSLFRQFQRTLRVCTQGMVTGDPAFAEDKWVYWLRTILEALNLAPGFVRDSYCILADETSRALEVGEREYLIPLLDRAVSILSDTPELQPTPGL